MSSIISPSNYNVFDTLLMLQIGASRKWTRREAEEYFRWFLGIKQARIDQILTASSIDAGTPRDDVFSNITETLRRSMTNLVHYEDGVQQINDFGIIVAFDAALVVGESLVAAVEGASWKVMQTTINNFISKNLPVVRKAGGDWAFEPIWEGRLIVSLLGRETHGPPSNVVGSKFATWREQLTL